MLDILPDDPLGREELADALAETLSNVVVFQYMAHGFHWNVKGPHFAQFHEFFGEIYEDAQGSEDDLAENIRRIGYDAPSALPQFMALSNVQYVECSSDPLEMSQVLLEANSVVIDSLNGTFTIANAINEQGVANLIAERIDMHKKWQWQLISTLGLDEKSMGKSKAESPLEVSDHDYSLFETDVQPEEVFVPTTAAVGKIVSEEQDLAQALLDIANKYGKFNEDDTGIWAGYTPAAENEVAAIGVKCSNCVLYRGGSECAIISAEVEPEGKCRFAVIPDGVVSLDENPIEKMFSKPPYLAQDELKQKVEDLDDYEEEYLNISDLIPTQTHLDPSKFKDARSITKPVIVYEDADGYKLVDGHHRCASKAIAGETKIMARVYRGLVAAASLFTAIPISPDDIELSADGPCWDGYEQIGMKMKNGKKVPNCVPINAAATEFAATEDSCPPATRDIVLNVTNRQNAIDNVGYGPLNPLEPNDEFWQEKADRWKTTPEESKKSICGNCVFFVRTPSMLNCIEGGLAEGGSGEQNAWDAIDKAELGYCEALDFKCAASRTCNAWAAGGPITEEKSSTETSDDTVSYSPADARNAVYASGSKPAPKKDRIKGSKKNAPGSAKNKKKVITFSKEVEASLRKKVTDHNAKAKTEGRQATLPMLKAVYRRGAGAYSSSHRPNISRAAWAMARVNAFLHLLKTGKPASVKYTQDNDLLPAKHPKAPGAITASIFSELAVELKEENEYASPEHAIFALAEFSGMGYEIIPALRASWARAVKNDETPYKRAMNLATKLYNSNDADLLPADKKGTLE